MGGRPYVNGLTLLEEGIGGFEALTGTRPTAVRRFHARRFVRAHATLAVAPFEAARGSRRARTAAARIDLDTPAGAFTALIEPDEGRPTQDDRVEYARAAYVPHLAADADGVLVAELAQVTGMVDLLRASIEAAHRHETATARAASNPGRVSWGWVKGLPWLPDAEAAAVASVRYEPPRTVPGRGVSFVLRDLHVTPEGPPAEVAFFVPLPGHADPALGDPR